MALWNIWYLFLSDHRLDLSLFLSLAGRSCAVVLGVKYVAYYSWYTGGTGICVCSTVLHVLL